MRKSFLRIAGMLLWTIGAAAQSADDVVDRVRSLYERGDWAEAAKLAGDAAVRSADLHLFRGLALARLKKLDEARQAFLDGNRAYPSDARFDLELAGLAYLNQDNQAAKKRLQKALRFDPSNAYGNDFLASLFLLDGNVPAALKYWNRAGKPLIQEFRLEPALRLDPILAQRTMAISAGQVFTLDRLRTTEANLDRLDLLADYHFDLALRPDQRFDLTFRSIESSPPASGWMGRILPYARGLPFQTVFVDWDNLGQRAIHLDSLVRWDPDKQRVNLAVAAPLKMNPRVKYRFAIDARDENWNLQKTFFGRPGGLDLLVLRKVEAGGELVYGWTNRLQWTTGAWVAKRGIRADVQNPTFAILWSMELRNGVSYRLWDSPERRLLTTASAWLRAGRVFPASLARFSILQGSLDTQWFPQSKGDDWIVNHRFAAGRAFGSVPFDDLFILGMERDNDLWLRGHVGTKDGRKGSAPLGTQYVLMQSSVQRTVFRMPFTRVQAGPFFDVGTIADPNGQFGSRGWMEDTGLEASVQALNRWKLTVIYGRNLRDGTGVFYAAVSR